MPPNFILSLCAALGIWLVLLAAGACQEPATATPMPTATPTAPPPVTQPANPPATAAIIPTAQPTEPQPQTDAAVTGTVIYGNGDALPAGATLTVDLRDISLADAPSVLIGQQVIPAPGPSPVSYRVNYRRAAIDPRHDYSVSARIESSDGKLLFTNDTVYPALTYGNSDRADLELIAIE